MLRDVEIGGAGEIAILEFGRRVNFAFRSSLNLDCVKHVNSESEDFIPINVCPVVLPREFLLSSCWVPGFPFGFGRFPWGSLRAPRWLRLWHFGMLSVVCFYYAS